MTTAMFLLVFCLLVPVSVFMMLKHYRNKIVFWSAVTLFSAGMSGLQVTLEDIVIPIAVESGFPWVLTTGIMRFTDKLNALVHAVPHWSILVFFLHYSGYPNRYLHAILSLPVLLTLWKDKIQGAGDLWPNYPLIVSFGVPYAFATLLLLGFTLLKERKRKRLLQHSAVASIFLIPQAVLLWYQADGWLLHSQFDHLLFLSILLLCCGVLVVTLYVRNAFLGVPRDEAAGKLEVGAGMMQHAVKNAAGKIKLNALSIRRKMELGRYDEVGKYVERLLDTNDHLLAVLDRITYMMRNRIEPEWETVDAGEVIEQAAAAYRTSPNVNIVAQTPGGSVQLELDRSLVVECLTNLIDNALDAMEGAGTVEIRLIQKRRTAAFSVTDTGRGMDPVELANAAEPFVSAKSKSGRNFGLGLYYVRKVMNAHRGRMRIASEPGTGTTVTLEFPRYRSGLRAGRGLWMRRSRM